MAKQKECKERRSEDEEEDAEDDLLLSIRTSNFWAETNF